MKFATFKIFKACPILPFGFPLVITAVGNTSDNFQQSEYYRIFCKMPTGFDIKDQIGQFNNCAFTHAQILGDAKNNAETELAAFLSKLQMSSPRDYSKLNEEFQLEEVEGEELLAQQIHRNIFPALRKIKKQTACDELKEYLSQIITQN